VRDRVACDGVVEYVSASRQALRRLQDVLPGRRLFGVGQRREGVADLVAFTFQGGGVSESIFIVVAFASVSPCTTTGCCPNSFPLALHATLTVTSGTCACLNHLVVPITWYGSIWTATFKTTCSSANQNITVQFQCLTPSSGVLGFQIGLAVCGGANQTKTSQAGSTCRQSTSHFQLLARLTTLAAAPALTRSA
jgi:hypothetical protein